MYPDLPIEQLLRRKDTRFQLGFASEAKDLVPDRDDFLLSASRKGLHILAKNEDSLAVPVEVLREAYGSKLEVLAPRVRLIEGVQVQEPVMHVRVSLHRRHLDSVKQALENRSATLTEEYARSSYCVLRFEAPLADLLGLSAELGKLAEGTAKHWVALSHYRLVTRHPGGTAA
jgi:predicted membrane GTPase involved in stress response